MTSKVRHQQRALARMDRQPSAGSLPHVVDPVSVGLDRSITIDMAKLPQPTVSYDADYAWIEHKPGDVRLFFAKGTHDDQGRLRSRLELRYPPESLLGHFWRNSREFHERMKTFAAKWPDVRDDRDAVRPETFKAEKEHSEWANFESMAHSGTEALIDFYSLPVTGLARFVAGQGSDGLKIISVVRVQMTIFELTRLLDSMEQTVREIENYLPEGGGQFYEKRSR